MIVREISRKADEPARIAFDRVSREVRALFARGYASKMPGRRGLNPGQFALETLPGCGGWKITIEPIPGESPERFAA